MNQAWISRAGRDEVDSTPAGRQTFVLTGKRFPSEDIIQQGICGRSTHPRSLSKACPEERDQLLVYNDFNRARTEFAKSVTSVRILCAKGRIRRLA